MNKWIFQYVSIKYGEKKENNNNPSVILEFDKLGKEMDEMAEIHPGHMITNIFKLQTEVDIEHLKLEAMGGKCHPTKMVKKENK